MKVEDWYATAFCALALLLFLQAAWAALSPSVRAHLHMHFLRHIQYPAAAMGRYNTGMTRLQLLLLLLYVSANIVALLLFAAGLRDRHVRAARLVVSNLAALPLTGPGSTVAGWFRLTQEDQDVAHRWIGRVAFALGVVHVSMVLILQPKPGQVVSAGVVVAGGLASLVFLTFRPLRRRLRAYIGIIHLLLVLCVLGGLIWHVITLPQPSILTKISTVVVTSLWLLSCPILLARLAWRGTWGTITRVDLIGAKAVSIQARTGRPVRIAPGKYFDLWRWRKPFRAYRSIALAADIEPLFVEKGTQDITFTVLDVSSQHEVQAWLGQSVLIDGPHGPDLQLGTFENIFATAEGIGIASILSAAICLAARRRHDRILRDSMKSLDQALLVGRNPSEERLALSRKPAFRDTGRRLSIFWSIDDNEQVQHFESQILLLQNLDPDQSFLTMWCVLPSRQRDEMQFSFQQSDTFICVYPERRTTFFEQTVRERLIKEAQAPGQTVVLGCGTSQFTSTMRQIVIDCMERHGPIKFITEFPRVRSASTRHERRSLNV